MKKGQYSALCDEFVDQQSVSEIIEAAALYFHEQGMDSQAVGQLLAKLLLGLPEGAK